MSFKLPGASHDGGRLADTKLPINRQLRTKYAPQINSIFRVDGKMGSTKYRFLLDSGAAVSVVRLDALDPEWHSQIETKNLRTAVGADGLPLDVVGQVVAPVSLGEFQAVHEFTVVRSLTTDCILGADFLTKHGAVMVCRAATLSLGDVPRLQVESQLARKSQIRNSPKSTRTFV